MNHAALVATILVAAALMVSGCATTVEPAVQESIVRAQTTADEAKSIATQALVRGLLKELAGGGVENSFVGGGAIVADDRLCGGAAMSVGQRKGRCICKNSQ